MPRGPVFAASTHFSAPSSTASFAAPENVTSARTSGAVSLPSPPSCATHFAPSGACSSSGACAAGACHAARYGAGRPPGWLITQQSLVVDHWILKAAGSVVLPGCSSSLTQSTNSSSSASSSSADAGRCVHTRRPPSTSLGSRSYVPFAASRLAPLTTSAAGSGSSSGASTSRASSSSSDGATAPGLEDLRALNLRSMRLSPPRTSARRPSPRCASIVPQRRAQWARRAR